jgi:site-specific DNA recombinase
MKRCALYCRVSTEEQVEMFGLDSQARSVREYAAAKQYQVQLSASDEGYSGADLDRPGLEQLRAAIRLRTIDVVVCHDPDRLSRKLAHLAIIQDECERFGVTLEFVTTPIAPNAEGRMFLSLKGIFAEYEREKIRERTLRGRREKARQGFIVAGVAPYGYKHLGKADGERGRLVVDEDQAAVVRQAFTWCLEGCSVLEIACRLNAAGIRPMRSSRWGKSTVFRLLRNETYAGTAYFNRRQRTEPEIAPPGHASRQNKKSVLRFRKNEEWIPVEVPAIISRETFDQVAERLRGNLERMAGRPTRSYLLTGLFYCGLCDRRMGACPSHGNRYYRCCGRDRLALPRCTGNLVHGERVEHAVWNAVTSAFRDPRRLRSLVEKHLAAVKAKPANTADIEKRIQQLRRREFRATQALVDCDVDEQLQMLRAELAASRAERRRLESELAAVPRSKPTNIDHLCQAAARAVDALEHQERREFLKAVVTRAVYRQEAKTVDVHCVLPVAGNRSNQPDDWNDFQFLLVVDLKEVA